MAELRESHTIFGPFLDQDPLDTALLFCRTNRYQVVATQRGPVPDALRRADEEGEELPEDVIVKLELSRGTPGRGWTSSNLAELPTKLELSLAGDKVEVRYDIVTTGQLLRGEERDFWKREARALEAYLLEEGSIPNLAADEAVRAGEVRREFLIMGLWIGTIVAALIFVVVIGLLT